MAVGSPASRCAMPWPAPISTDAPFLDRGQLPSLRVPSVTRLPPPSAGVVRPPQRGTCQPSEHDSPARDGYRPIAGFEGAYRAGRPAWDVGRPQPAIVELAARASLQGPLLDVGCGTGEHALYLAALGLSVAGIDIAPTAIARARAKAAARNLAVDFRVADALLPETGGPPCASVLDCGLLHVLSDAERRAYARSLWAMLRPAGHVYVLCLSDAAPGTRGPRRISPADLLATFARGWHLEALSATCLLTRGPLDEHRAPAWLAILTRLEGEGPDGGGHPGAPRPTWRFSCDRWPWPGRTPRRGCRRTRRGRPRSPCRPAAARTGRGSC